MSAHTRTSPDLGQIAVHLPRLFTHVHHISAQRLRCDGKLGEVLVTVAEVHGQEHLAQ